MPKINPARPAAVYAPDLPGAQEALYPALTARRLYVLDDRTEQVVDMARPVRERPVLRLHMLHASMGEEHGAAAFVTDSLATIGDEAERVAVVGTLLTAGCQVIVDGRDLDGSWYQERVRHLGYAAVGGIIDGLLDFRDAERLWGHWPTTKIDGPLTVLPTSLRLHSDKTRMRVRELVELRDLPVAAAVERLTVEGYRNAKFRNVWYPKAVRDLLEQGL